MSKEKKISTFDPNSVSTDEGNVFGLPYTPEEASLVLLPVPWDVTVSYSDGTSKGPAAILEASAQVDLFDPFVKDSWKIGVSMDDPDRSLLPLNQKLRAKAKTYIRNLGKGISEEAPAMRKIRKEVDKACEEMNAKVYKQAKHWISAGKVVGLVGGDHSTPLGLIRALAEQYDEFGILQFDGHCDLRKAFEGFEYSHASVMYNALKTGQVKKLVQVGIRDWCEEEDAFILSSKGRVKTFFDHVMKKNQYEGKSWMDQCAEIIAYLPDDVYVSFDIDGLDPKLCPNTGTPVPGGLEFEQALYLIQAVVKSGRRIIGFDLNEVAPGPDEWDGNVGARLLFRMCNLAAVSNQLAAWHR